MNKLSLLLLFFSLPALAATCEPKPYSTVSFAHAYYVTGYEYQLMTQLGDNVFHLQRVGTFNPDATTFVTDVPEGQSMSVKIFSCRSDLSFGSTFDRLEFHLHTPSSLEPGGWDHGKQGHGMNQSLQ